MAGINLTGDTSGSIALNAPAVAGTNTITLPAASGTVALTDQVGGLSLLGVLSTTSGTSQTLSSLNLTEYSFLLIFASNVSHSSGTASALRIGGATVTNTFASTNGVTTVFYVNLIDGYTFNPGIISGGSLTGYSSSTTAITFDWTTSATFDSGLLYVYGMK